MLVRQHTRLQSSLLALLLLFLLTPAVSTAAGLSDSYKPSWPSLSALAPAPPALLSAKHFVKQCAQCLRLVAVDGFTLGPPVMAGQRILSQFQIFGGWTERRTATESRAPPSHSVHTPGLTLG